VHKFRHIRRQTEIVESVPNSGGDLRSERNSQAQRRGQWMSPTTETRRRNWYQPLLEERTRTKKRKLNPNTAKHTAMEGFSLIYFFFIWFFSFSRFPCSDRLRLSCVARAAGLQCIYASFSNFLIFNSYFRSSKKIIYYNNLYNIILCVYLSMYHLLHFIFFPFFIIRFVV